MGSTQQPFSGGNVMSEHFILPLRAGQFSKFILSQKGRQLGAFKRGAKLAGISFQEYIFRLDSGLKRCIRCREWISLDKFCEDNTRWDGWAAKCADCNNRLNRDRYIPIPFHAVKIPGPTRQPSRDDDKIQARSRVNKDVVCGLRPDPNALHCVLCGHKGTDRRHEYHHYMGYAAQHHFEVFPLCSKCHHDQPDSAKGRKKLNAEN